MEGRVEGIGQDMNELSIFKGKNTNVTGAVGYMV